MKSLPLVIKDKTKESEVAPLVRRENEIQSVLRRALELLGPNGENWCKGSEGWIGPHYCVEGALCFVTKLNYGRIDDHPACLIFTRAANQAPWVFNDDAKDFSEVRAMFERAIELAADAPLGAP